ncbi:sensor histidine kinase [Archangium violaceum]|nr:HAMP domain-containing sensor histidine kinase [Archangium violaceum]
MSFVEDLKSYLLRLRHVTESPLQPEPVSLDPAWVRSMFIQLFEKWERERAASLPNRELAQMFRMWTAHDRGVRFADVLAVSLQTSFLRGGTREDVEQYVGFAMGLRLGLSPPVPSKARMFELERLADLAWARTESFSGADTWMSLPDYALEIRAVRRVMDRLVLTPIGNVFVSLSGRDAVQWLLSIEVAQSTGPLDEWRLSTETVAALLTQPVMHVPIDVWSDSEFPHAWATMRRLNAMGLLRLPEDDFIVGYELTDSGLNALQALDSSTGTPFSVLATTLSQDEALAALDSTTGKTLPEASLHSSAQAAARQARLVAHEIRNALIPAQFALNSLYESLVGSTAEAEVTRFRPRIDPGISRVFKFVTDLLKTSELATRPPESFNFVRAVLDAQVALTTSLEIQVIGPTELPPVLGYRERFVLALVNLLRNAEQASARHVEIELKLEEDGQNILVTVDDDGPGVPEEHRERIFQRGVSLRPGGTGEGLALVKEVIEFELRGKIACVERPGGGARFRMRVPLAERSGR